MSKLTLCLLASAIVALSSPCLAEGGGGGAGGGHGGGAGFGASSYYNICRHEVRAKFCPTGTCPKVTDDFRKFAVAKASAVRQWFATQSPARRRRSRLMTHKRIRKFNTSDTYPEQKLDNDLCQAVVARGTMVFVRGQVGQDLDTSKSVAIGDPAGQAERAMANIKTLLEEAGARLAHICKITIYITDPRYREPVYRTIGKWLKGVHPVSTGIVVSALARPEWLVEVDATAVIPDAP
jgi:enamine deaminase RidA (YjgF/YER057c/UK114 family)